MNYVDATARLEDTFRQIGTAQGVVLSDWAKPSSVEVKFGDGGTKLRHIPVVDHEAVSRFRLGVIETLQAEIEELKAVRPDLTKGGVLASALAGSYWAGA